VFRRVVRTTALTWIQQERRLVRGLHVPSIVGDDVSVGV
jgi:hypothetical protein